jgi:hypothetical protein
MTKSSSMQTVSIRADTGVSVTPSNSWSGLTTAHHRPAHHGCVSYDSAATAAVPLVWFVAPMSAQCLCHCCRVCAAVEDLLLSSAADYASWLPDISPPTDDEDDGEVADTSAECVEAAQAAAAAGASCSDAAGLEAAVAGLAISEDASGSSSPGIAASRHADVCKSPNVQPW